MQDRAQPSPFGLDSVPIRTPGNIDINARPVVHNADGTISTVASMSIGTDDGEVLIPTVAADGSRVLSPEEAIAQYQQTGQHLGIFATPDDATNYAERLHEQQAWAYGDQLGKPVAPTPK